MFRKLLKIAKEDVKLYKTRDLRDPDDRRRRLYGHFSEENGEAVIFLDAHGGDDMPIVSTLIHELLHRFFDLYTKEFHGHAKHRIIYLLENLLFERFTEEQRKALESHLPRHFVKKQPG